MSPTTTIRAAGPDRVAVLAAVLAASFVDDPMIRWPFHEHHVEERSQPLFTALLDEYAKHGMLWEADDGAGAATWIPPDQGFGLEEMNVLTWPAIVELTDDGGDRYHRFWDWLESFVPEEPHWMLDILGVDPALQGRGIGGELIRHGVDLARGDDLPVFLETGNARNVPYYERFGFRMAHEEDAPEGGPHMWFMRLDP